MLGLVVDIGWAYYRKEAAQAAADASAQAAALAAYSDAGGATVTCATTGVACWTTETQCPSVITNANNNMLKGCLYAQANGFTTGGRVNVVMQSNVGAAPTASGVTVSYWVVAKVIEREPQLFSAAMGHANATVAARATTGVREGTNGGCVFTMNPNQYGALRMTGNALLQSGCGVFVNSNNGNATDLNGGGRIVTTGTSKTEIVGNCGTSCGNISPAAQNGASVMTDPFGDMVPPPDPGSCSNTGVSLGSHQTLTLNPGKICGNISLGSQSSLTLNPGTYYVTGGIDLGAQTSMSGTGVTIYMQNGGVNMTGGATVNLTAPTSGTYQGVLFFQARGNTTDSSLVGGNTQNMSGVLYFPSAHLNYTGGSSTTATATTIVANTLNMVGNSYISAAATTQFTGVTGGVFIVE